MWSLVERQLQMDKRFIFFLNKKKDRVGINRFASTNGSYLISKAEKHST
jgi:hypothetical protein